MRVTWGTGVSKVCIYNHSLKCFIFDTHVRFNPKKHGCQFKTWIETPSQIYKVTAHVCLVEWTYILTVSSYYVRARILLCTSAALFCVFRIVTTLMLLETAYTDLLLNRWPFLHFDQFLNLWDLRIILWIKGWETLHLVQNMEIKNRKLTTREKVDERRCVIENLCTYSMGSATPPLPKTIPAFYISFTIFWSLNGP